MTKSNDAVGGSGLFLPDLCGMRAVFVVVIAAELLAMVLTLASDGRGADVWRELALTSLFVQWVALSSLAVLCLSRPLLLKLGNVRAALLSWLTILAVTALVTEVAWQVFVPGINASAQAHWQFTMTQPGVSSLRPLQAVTHSHDEFMLSSLAIAAIVSAVVLRYFYVQFQWKARVESENQARLQALQSRIRPHFLFNSMNTIASLARSDPALAEQITEDLAALFRVSLGDAQVSGTVGQEMELCRQYLRIEGVRLGERLKVTLDVDELPENASLPTLTLQPLVENAVYHGVEPSPDGGDITISGQCASDQLRIRIENSCPDSGLTSGRPGNQMALDNVRQRLAAFYDGNSEVTVEHSNEPGRSRFMVELRFELRSAVS